jgi:hypothetical protein
MVMGNQTKFQGVKDTLNNGRLGLKIRTPSPNYGFPCPAQLICSRIAIRKLEMKKQFSVKNK